MWPCPLATVRSYCAAATTEASCSTIRLRHRALAQCSVSRDTQRQHIVLLGHRPGCVLQVALIAEPLYGIAAAIHEGQCCPWHHGSMFMRSVLSVL